MSDTEQNQEPQTEPDETPEPDQGTVDSPAIGADQESTPPDPDEAPTSTPDEGDVTGPTTLPDEERDPVTEGETPEAPPAAPSMLDAKARAVRDDKIDRENERHAKRVGEIMEEEATALIPCPICMDAFHGWIFDPAHAPLTPEQRDRMLQLLGMNDWEELPQASWAQECATCRGHGRVKTGSKREGRETTGCLDCGESGWINRRAAQVAVENGHHADVPAATGPTVYGTEPDPRVQALREDGYTVIPPMPIQGA